MTATLTKTLTRADVDAMTIEQRLDLLELLWDSIDPADIEFGDEHDEEIKRRLEACERDPSGNVSWGELRAQLAERRRK